MLGWEVIRLLEKRSHSHKNAVFFTLSSSVSQQSVDLSAASAGED